MKNTFGNAITVTLFGESHGEEIGAVLDGLAPGLPVSEENIKKAFHNGTPLISSLLYFKNKKLYSLEDV